MHRWVDLHWGFVRVVVGNLLVHLEEVAVFRLHHVLTEFLNVFFARVVKAFDVGLCFPVTLDGAGKVEEYGLSCGIHSKSFIATLFGGARSNISRHEVTE